MFKDKIQELESNIALNKEVIELGLALDRLASNRDFKKVVLEGYFKNEAVRLVHLKGKPDQSSESNQADIINKINSISHFSMYLQNLIKEAELAYKSVELDEQTRNEIILEEQK